MNLKKIIDAQFSREEMLKDYEQVKYATTLAEKKEVAAKYDIDSKKAADIQKGILEQMREERKTRSSFDIEDVRSFGRLSDSPEQYAKMASFLSQESRAFVEYLAKFYYEDLEKHGILKRAGDVETPLTRVPYGLSYSDKFAINRYANTKKFLRENTDEFKSAKEVHENQIGVIRAKLDEQMQEFKQLYIKRTVEFAERKWNVAKDNLDKALERYHNLFEQTKEFENSLYAQGKGYYEVRSNPELKETGMMRDNAWKTYAEYKTITHYSKEEYMQMAEKDANDTYEKNITVLAEKVNKWEVNPDAMQVTKVADDPRYFEMEVTDGAHKLYARSIWAAEYSTLVTPHFRFIITERK